MLKKFSIKMWQELDSNINSVEFSMSSEYARYFSNILINEIDNFCYVKKPNYEKISLDFNINDVLLDNGTKYGYTSSFIMILLMINLLYTNPMKYSIKWKKIDGVYPKVFEIAMGNEDYEHPEFMCELFIKIIKNIYCDQGLIIPSNVIKNTQLKKYTRKVFLYICWMNYDKEILNSELIYKCLSRLFILKN